MGAIAMTWPARMMLARALRRLPKFESLSPRSRSGASCSARTPGRCFESDRRRQNIAMKVTSIFPVMILAFASAHGQENWPQFRGEDSTGVSHNQKLPIAWSTNLNVAWKTSIPGVGWSSPIVWGDRILITSVIKEGEVEPPRKGLYFGGERPTPSTSLHHWMVY